MKIAMLRGQRNFEIVDAPRPAAGHGEVLVHVAACGVCTGELDMWDGRAGNLAYPRYPGHEVSGIVEAVGEGVTAVRPGEAVGVWVLERGFAEYVSAQEQFCLPAGNVPLDTVLAEPLACAVNSVELANPALGDDVVIIGAGFMGNLIQKLVALRGPRQLIVADTRPDALERAQRLGASRVVDVARESLGDIVKGLTQERGADVTFEVTGTQSALQTVGDVTRMSGKAVIVGFHQGEPRKINLAYWNWMAFQILNAHFRDPAIIARGMQIGMRLLTSGRLSMGELVTHRYPLSEINAAFQMACEKPEGFVKATVLL